MSINPLDPTNPFTFFGASKSVDRRSWTAKKIRLPPYLGALKLWKSRSESRVVHWQTGNSEGQLTKMPGFAGSSFFFPKRDLLFSVDSVCCESDKTHSFGPLAGRHLRCGTGISGRERARRSRWCQLQRRSIILAGAARFPASVVRFRSAGNLTGQRAREKLRERKRKREQLRESGLGEQQQQHQLHFLRFGRSVFSQRWRGKEEPLTPSSTVKEKDNGRKKY